jgi:hypothetical protein
MKVAGPAKIMCNPHLSVDASTIPGDDVDAGMLPQPGGDPLRRVVGEQIDDALPLQVFLGLHFVKAPSWRI